MDKKARTDTPVMLHFLFEDGSNPYVKRCKDRREAGRELRRWKRHWHVSGPVSKAGTVETYRLSGKTGTHGGPIGE